MIKHKTSRFSHVVILLVGVCLVGSAFHVHQLHPDYEIHQFSLDHLHVTQPDCIACISLIHATPASPQTGIVFRLEVSNLIIISDSEHLFSCIADLNNKSPPPLILNPRAITFFKKIYSIYV